MPFTYCCIIGLGLLGGSLAIDLRRRFPEMVITGVARRRETLEEAAGLRCDDVPVFTHLSTQLADAAPADLVVLCTPVQTEIEQLADLTVILRPGTVVTEVGSTKRMILNAATTALPPSIFFVGGHPMAGSDRAGLAHARGDLYRGATWALCIPEGAEDAATRLAELIEALGAKPLILDADTHDAVVALTSHLPHVVACALAARVLGEQDQALVRAFIAGGFRDTTRIAAANTAMWRDILLTNRDNLVRELNAMLDSLTRWRDALRSGDEPMLDALLTTAHTLREGLGPKRTE